MCERLLFWNIIILIIIFWYRNSAAIETTETSCYKNSKDFIPYDTFYNMELIVIDPFVSTSKVKGIYYII